MNEALEAAKGGASIDWGVYWEDCCEFGRPPIALLKPGSLALLRGTIGVWAAH